MARERTKEPIVDKARKAVGLKGQSEASRRVFQKGPRKGEKRKVNIIFKQGSTQKTKDKKMHSGKPGEPVKNLVARVKGRKEATTRLKQRTTEGHLKSLKEGTKTKFGRLTPQPTKLLKATPPAVIAGVLTNSSPTNMADYTSSDGKKYNLPDSMVAKLKRIKTDNNRSEANNYNFEKAYAVATKNGQGTFKWDGRTYKSGAYDRVQKQINSLKESEVPIVIEGAYLGKRKKTVSEGVKEIRKKEPKKRASKTGLPKNKGPRNK